ncbi:MAG: polysaccharide deacetylase family protein [Deltaproteobacteria bacterium]|nr:polysaccharide deacetylase family protein [Deltaproteobacteria bacterium]
MSLGSVSVDLDGLRCYHEIHGLGPGPETGTDPIFAASLSRFAELFEELGLRATFFVVGRDLEDPTQRARVALLAAAGHEIANHSLDHRYDLTLLEPEAIEQQVGGAARAIEAAVGRAPIGFRAPGYVVSDALFEVLARTGVRYDSSVFPCPAYHGAKALAMARIRLAGRRSRSILGSPRVLVAPPDPYAVGRRWFARRTSGGDPARLVELPIGVATGARLPFIGTTLVLAGPRGAAWLGHRMRDRPFVNIELHAIDLCDPSDPGLASIAGVQPDLRVSLARKTEALRAAIGQVRRDGARFVTLAEAAATGEW